MKKLTSTLLKSINTGVVILYLLTCLIPYLPTGKYWMVAILGLIFPILFFIVLAFMTGWIVARSRWFMLSLFALIISWKQLSVVFGFTTKSFSIAKSSDTLRVLTWNVSSWGETSKARIPDPEIHQHMINFVKSQRPDVLCFQEFFDLVRPGREYSIIKTFKEMGYNYSYYVKTFHGDTTYNMGVAILSKFPMVDTVKYYYGEADYAEHLIYADIQFHNQAIRVFTTHLQSVRFENAQYASIRKIKSKDAGLSGSKTIIGKLKLAYHYRGAEADLVRQKIDASPYPVVVCGDFNDVPNSYTYFKIKGDLQDAFLAKGSKLGRTFRYLSPTLRIDYILADKKFEVKQFNRTILPYSDHYPIVADFDVSPPGPDNSNL
ncbi:MAG: endonuclease/exonuclease/phosphatase family protein [Ferruginibacter sp.]